MSDPLTGKSTLPQKTLVLVGLPGAGKSTISRRLASALQHQLVDSDKLIEAETGMSCGEYFSSVGEPAFRELEAEIVARAVAAGGVVSLGGGAILNEQTRELLREYPVIWLDVSVEEGVRRALEEGGRPLLAGDNPEDIYRKLAAERLPLYAQVARYRIKTDRKTPQAIVADILAQLEADQ